MSRELSEREFQNYCAYKLIEKDIKGCLDRERKLEKENNQLKAKVKELEEEKKVGDFWHSAYQGKQLDYDLVYSELRKEYDKNNKLQQQLAEQPKQITKRNIAKIRAEFDNENNWCYGDNHKTIVIRQDEFNKFLDNLIKKYEGNNNENNQP